LKPVLADLAAAEGLACFLRDDFEVTTAQLGKEPSQWVAMARRPEDLGTLAKNANVWSHLLRESDWQPLPPRAQPKVWSDDFSNLLGTFRWH
jgi:hypothetical protein